MGFEFDTQYHAQRKEGNELVDMYVGTWKQGDFRASHTVREQVVGIYKYKTTTSSEDEDKGLIFKFTEIYHTLEEDNTRQAIGLSLAFGRWDKKKWVKFLYRIPKESITPPSSTLMGMGNARAAKRRNRRNSTATRSQADTARRFSGRHISNALPPSKPVRVGLSNLAAVGEEKEQSSSEDNRFADYEACAVDEKNESDSSINLNLQALLNDAVKIAEDQVSSQK